MSSNIERIVIQALSTFSKPQTRMRFQENLNGLIQNVSQVTLSDVHVDRELITSFDRSHCSNNNLVYISVFEDPNIVVSVFILKSNSFIPLHDHPLMHGILKVIYGSVHIQSYTLLERGINQRNPDEVHLPSKFFFLNDRLYDSDDVKVSKNPPVVISDQDNCAFLTPLQNNIHEVRSYNGPSAFLDILAPPYETNIEGFGPRHCTYFADKGFSINETILKRLIKTPDYCTKEMKYRGPKIRVNS